MKMTQQKNRQHKMLQLFNRSLLPAVILLLGLSACSEEEYNNPGYEGIPYATYNVDGQVFGLLPISEIENDTIPLEGMSVVVRKTTQNYESITDESPSVTLTTDSEGRYHYTDDNALPNGPLRIDVSDLSGTYASSSTNLTMSVSDTDDSDGLYYGEATRTGVNFYLNLAE